MTYYVIALILAVLSMGISFFVQAMFNKYSSEQTAYTGATAAAIILRNQGLTDVRLQEINGSLTDNYNPTSNILNLSTAVYNVSSVSAVAVAAHEVGHAIQHAEAYPLLMIRKKIVPVANISSNLSYILILAGIFFEASNLIMIGAVLFSAIVVFNLITLPVEIDASNRALAMIQQYRLVSEDQMGGARIVLRAAGMTYFISLMVSVVTLLRYISIAQSRNRRR